MKLEPIFVGAILAIGVTSCTKPMAQTSSQGQTQVAEIAGADWQQTSKDITHLLERYNAPSVSVAVISNGDIVFAEGFGLGNIESNQAATTQTQYAIGSIVKTFTSALIGGLEAQGEIDLSANPSSYIDNLQFKSAGLAADLQVEHLLSQTSGLPFMDGSLSFFPEADQTDLAPRISYFEPSCRTGECWAYNNLNFMMLDMVAESVTGQSKSQLLVQRLLGPAKMTGTVSSTKAFFNSPDAARGYAQVDGKMVPTAVEYLYGEQVYATASDMARWLGLWMNEGGGVIPADYVQRAISMQAIDNGRPPSKDEPGNYLFGYGYGWQIKSVDGNYVVHHGGNENGFSAQVLFVPASGVGFVTLTNQQNSILPYVVNDLLFRRVLELPAPDIDTYPVQVGEAAALISNQSAKLSVNADAPLGIKLDSLPGDYQAAGYGKIEVRLADGVLTFKTPAAEFVLVHREGNIFGLAVTEPVPLGINTDFFEITFSPGAFSANFASAPVVFSKID